MYMYMYMYTYMYMYGDKFYLKQVHLLCVCSCMHVNMDERMYEFLCVIWQDPPWLFLLEAGAFAVYMYMYMFMYGDMFYLKQVLLLCICICICLCMGICST